MYLSFPFYFAENLIEVVCNCSNQSKTVRLDVAIMPILTNDIVLATLLINWNKH